MANYINKLKKFTTCDISDGLVNLYNISNGGYFPNLVRRSGTATVVGKAFPVLFGLKEACKDIPEVNYIDSVPDNCIPVSYTHLDVYKRQVQQLQQQNPPALTQQLTGGYAPQTSFGNNLSLIHI